MPSMSRNVLLSGFMTQLSQVDGFPCSYEDLQRFAEQIPKDSGFKPTKTRDGVRAKTVYNVWCGTHWKEHCIQEYGKSLPLADVKDKGTGEITTNAHTDLRKEMYTEFQKSKEYDELKATVEEENKKLGKSTPVKRKATKAQQIEELRKELEEVKKKNSESNESVEEQNEQPEEDNSDEEENSEEVKEDEVKEDEVKEDEVKEDEVKEDEVKEDEVKEDEVKEKEVKDEFDEMDTNGDGVVDREEFEAHLEQKNKQNDTLCEQQVEWARKQFTKSSATTCFKAWLMANHSDVYGPEKKTRVSPDEYKEFKAQHDFDNFNGKNYTADNCDWFEFIPK
jgi:myosin heavy subunit